MRIKSNNSQSGRPTGYGLAAMGAIGLVWFAGIPMDRFAVQMNPTGCERAATRPFQGT